MSWLQIVLALYGILLIALGIKGYVDANSVPSLIAGSAAGVFAIVSAWILKSNWIAGTILGAVICFAMVGKFGPAAYAHFKWIPAGLVTISSAVVLICLGLNVMFSKGR